MFYKKEIEKQKEGLKKLIELVNDLGKKTLKGFKKLELEEDKNDFYGDGHGPIFSWMIFSSLEEQIDKIIEVITKQDDKLDAITNYLGIEVKFVEEKKWVAEKKVKKEKKNVK